MPRKPVFKKMSNDPDSQKNTMQMVTTLVAALALILSIIALVQINTLKSSNEPISVEQFLDQLTAHEETRSLQGIAPLNIIEITSENLANLQTQIQGIDASYVGSYLVQYTDQIVIYDYRNDELKGAVTLNAPQAQLPADFFDKLNTHAEVSSVAGQVPIGGELDPSTLATLQQQFPDIYANAKVGDYLLRYETKLVIYDYAQDAIVNSVDLG